MDVSITTDASGALYIGYTSSTVRVQKLNADRDLEWSITIENIDGWTRPYLAVDSTGGVYMAYEIPAAGEVCVAKIAADGSAYLWNRSYGGLGAESSAKLAIDGSDNVILVFATTGTIAGGTAAGGGSDVAVFKLNPSGDVLWSLQHPSLNTPGQDTEPVVTVAPSGALIVSYQTTESPAGGAGLMTSSIAPGPASANVTWTRSFPEVATGTVPCFLGETPIRTRRGVVLMRDLVVGDEVQAGRGGWTAVRRIKVTITVATPVTMPYIVPRGWRAAPESRQKATERFCISPNHCVAVPGRGMVRAAELGLRRSTRFREGDVFLYYNLEVDGWENIVVCGVEVESLAPNRVLRLTMAELVQMLVSEYGGVDAIPYERVFKQVRLTGDGTLLVRCMPKNASDNREAISQALAYSRVHSRAFSS